jgi:hypothetical protein
MNKYRIGNVRDPRPDDPCFDAFDAALVAALALGDTDTLDSPVIAVWEEDGYGKVVALVYEGGAYL